MSLRGVRPRHTWEIGRPRVGNRGGSSCEKDQSNPHSLLESRTWGWISRYETWQVSVFDSERLSHPHLVHGNGQRWARAMPDVRCLPPRKPRCPGEFLQACGLKWRRCCRSGSINRRRFRRDTIYSRFLPNSIVQRARFEREAAWSAAMQSAFPDPAFLTKEQRDALKCVPSSITPPRVRLSSDLDEVFVVASFGRGRTCAPSACRRLGYRGFIDTSAVR